MTCTVYDDLKGGVVGGSWLLRYFQEASLTRVLPLESSLWNKSPRQKIGVHETRILNVDYTEELEQWKHGRVIETASRW
jgi:hypothetical protein